MLKLAEAEGAYKITTVTQRNYRQANFRYQIFVFVTASFWTLRIVTVDGDSIEGLKINIHAQFIDLKLSILRMHVIHLVLGGGGRMGECNSEKGHMQIDACSFWSMKNPVCCGKTRKHLFTRNQLRVKLKQLMYPFKYIAGSSQNEKTTLRMALSNIAYFGLKKIGNLW